MSYLHASGATVRRFRKRPVEIEAIQWTGDNWHALRRFCPGATIDMTHGTGGRIHVPGIGAIEAATRGDWIVKDVDGYWVWTQFAFTSTYEEIT